jgi:2-polyprenyl-3-methyl-5-hydroxy-6-metoxy-1,4-benzoquinol methylase
MDENYIDVNRKSWNERVEAHLKSAFYDVAGFLGGDTSLKSIELDKLGDLKGKSVLHLQCHFGQDSISLARMGAEVTGVDLSDQAISAAKALAGKAREQVDFVCCDLYDLPKHLDRQFDLVFTSYGTIGWLPDLDKWAALINQYLKPGGRLLFVEFHPVVWMFDNDFTRIQYSYFNDGPIAETESGTYADREAEMQLSSISWNHPISEVVNSLIGNGLAIKSLDEFDYSPYDCFKHTIETREGGFRIAHLDHKIPMVYAIEAVKPF